MIDSAISFSVRRRGLILFATAAFAVWGGWSFLTLPIDAVPDITNVQVQINSVCKGLAPSDIETKVTYPIELAMSGTPGIREVRSLTKFGLAQVTAVFEDGADVYRARQLIAERLQGLPPLPPGAETPTLGPVSTGLGEVYHYAIRAKSAPTEAEGLMRAREVQDKYIKPRLVTVPGVAEVNVVGGLARQAHVHPRMDALARNGLGLSDLASSLEKTNRNVGGGYVRDGGSQLIVQAVGQFASLDDIRVATVKSLQNFRTVRVSDIADVRFGAAQRTGAALFSGKETTIGTVMMLAGANSRTVAKAVAERVDAIRASGELPSDVEIEPLYDRSDLVDATLGTILHNLAVGAALVMIVLFALLGNVKAAAIVSATIPITLLGTFGLMKAFGVSGNLMSLGALDFGIIVDGAVIVVDQCVRRIQGRARRGAAPESISTAVEGAAREIRQAAGFGQLMVIAAFVPILGLAGIEGKMFRPMAETFVIALAIALLLSFTFVPALAAALFSENESEREPTLMRRIDRLYSACLAGVLRKPGVTLAACALPLAISVWMFAGVGAEFLPQLDEGSIVFQVVRKPSVSLEESIAQDAKLQNALAKVGPVLRVFSRIGTPEIATDPMGPNESDIFIELKPQIRSASREKTELVERLLAIVKETEPASEISVTQPIQMRFNDLLEGTRADLTIKIFGDSLEQIQKTAREMAAEAAAVRGAGDVASEFRGAIPLLRVVPKLDALARNGASASPVLEAINIGMSGAEIGALYEGVRRIPLVIRLPDSQRDDPKALRGLLAPVADGLNLPLESVASIERSSITSPIFREGLSRRTAVLINPRGRDVQSYVQEAQARIAANVKIPEGTRIEWTGSFRNLQDAKLRLAILGPLAIALIGGMIFLAFGRWTETALVLLAVPLALSGGAAALAIFGVPFSISAGVGFIALSGIAVLNGVVLIHCWLDLQKTGAQSWIVDGARLRLRPVLMTALVDAFGFLPMAFSSGVGAEVQKPLATVIIGGIISSTALILIALPCAMALLHRERNPSS